MQYVLPPAAVVALFIYIAQFEPFVVFDQCILNVNTFPYQFEHDPLERKVEVRPSTVDGIISSGRVEIRGIECTLIFNDYFRRFVVGSAEEVKRRLLETQP